MRSVWAYLFLVQFAAVDALYGQPTLEWSRRYAGRPRGVDAALAVAVDDSGNVVVTGASENPNLYLDIATVKYSRSGQQLWVTRFNEVTNGNMRGSSIVFDSYGAVYIAGGTVLKYKRDGDSVWVHRVVGTEHAIHFLDIDNEGNLFGGGGGRFDDMATMRFDSIGRIVWTRLLNGPGNSFDRAYDQQLDGVGNIIATGRLLRSGRDYLIGTTKYTPNGDTVWIRYYDGPVGYDAGYAIAIDDSNNVYVTGESDVAEGVLEMVMIKYGPEGGERWVSRYHPAGSAGAAYGIVVDSIGNVYVVGVTGCCTFTLVKLNPSGQLQWTADYANRSFGLPPPKLALDRQGFIYVAATQDRQPWSDYVLAKYTGSGVQVWRIAYPGSGQGFHELYDLALDRYNNIYITGEGANDYLTLKFSQTPTAVQSVETVPKIFALHQNYPNPFNPTTTIAFDIPIASNVRLKVVDLLGREAATIVDEKLSAGTHERTFDASRLASGVYFYRLSARTPSGETSEFVETRKMIIMR